MARPSSPAIGLEAPDLSKMTTAQKLDLISHGILKSATDLFHANKLNGKGCKNMNRTIRSVVESIEPNSITGELFDPHLKNAFTAIGIIWDMFETLNDSKLPSDHIIYLQVSVLEITKKIDLITALTEKNKAIIREAVKDSELESFLEGSSLISHPSGSVREAASTGHGGRGRTRGGSA